MPRDPTKAQLIDLHAKEVEGYRAEITALRLENDDLQAKLAQARQDLQAEQERGLRQPAWEEEPPPRPRFWQRLRCRLGYHEPNMLYFSTMRNPPCLHCGHFQRGYR
jgi:regulator of replication initiation timing